MSPEGIEPLTQSRPWLAQFNTGWGSRYLLLISFRDFYFRCRFHVYPGGFTQPVGRDSSVAIATCYGLEGWEIESRWGLISQHPSRPDLVPTQRLFPGGNAAGAWR
jgi:hypothetical protein